MTEREHIILWLRSLAATASSEQSRGAYLHAAEGVARGDYEGGGGVRPDEARR